MGSSTGIGFVYHETQSINAENELGEMIKFMLSNNGSILSQKYCKDLDGDGWVESNEVAHLLIKDISSVIMNNYYGQLRMKCDILKKKGLIIDMYIKIMKGNHFGILLDIKDDQIFDPNTSLEALTNRIINLMKEIYSNSPFDYSFCDNEAQIEYSIHELMSIKQQVYSIVAIPNSKNPFELIISKSDWSIDGLTPRKS